MEENKEVFCSYDSQDQLLLAELKKHLIPSLKLRGASLWEEQDIPDGPGKREDMINAHLNTAPLILLLVSASYLNSEDCQHQVQQAMARNQQEKASVIPIILKPCFWEDQPFSKLSVLPTGAKDGKAVTSWRSRSKVWRDIVGRIVKTLDDMGIKPVTEQPPSAISRQQPVDEQLRILSDTVQPSLVVQKHMAEEEVPKKGRPAQPREEGKIAKIFITFLSIVVICALIITLFVLASAKKRNPQQATAIPTHSALITATPAVSIGSVNATMFGFDAQRTHFNPSEHILSPSTITSLQFNRKVSIGGGSALETYFPSSPAVVDGVIYVGARDGKLYAVNAHTGNTLWSAQTGTAITSSPTVVNGIVYIGSWDQRLYAFNTSTGKPLWVSDSMGNSIYSSPLVDNGVAYVGSQDGHLYALNTSTGHLSWSTPMIGLSITSSPTIANGIMYVGSWDGKVYAFDTKTHASKWTYPTQGIVWSSPAIAGGLVYVGSEDKNLYAIDATTGNLKWKYTTENAIRSSAAVANGVVYIGSDDGRLYALDASNGNLLWKSAAVDVAFFSSPTVANNLVYLSSNNGTLYVYQALGCGQAICSPLKTLSGLSGPILSSPTVVNGAVYLSSQNGELYSFDVPGTTL